MEQQPLQSIKLTAEQARKLLYQMLLIRRFEEKAAEMYTKEKIRGFLHLYIGEEAVAVGVMQALGPEDNVLCTYREHGHALVRGMDAGVIMAEMYGRQEGCCRGRGGSMHLFDAKTKFYGGNAIVAGHLAMAVGLGLADKKMKRKQLTCCFFGEGAMAEGAFHEAMNLAALWQVPVLFVCENNLYAMGTALRYTHAQTDLEKKGAAYGIASASVDGMDLMAVMQAANTAAESIRRTGQPYFLVCNTYRFRAHSMFDAELYREKSEVEEWKKRDPVPGFFNYLTQQHILIDNDFKEAEAKVEKEIEKAVEFADACSLEPVEELTKYTYSER
ncbi:pyruvate dehydrogenase (acetyl-transferring) E1 component subunit alpha [Pontibacter mangrovi]|uniref:Pyruvate dehydrogenase E1 component subunit alpha n=1 Tax=Pontibacter mangrovi TaxID=2589816 RepID=A0A501WBN5_9BACT|nr:pyruvate dehydrogenase (acetyl-transferring) E1 component subunit alpha [Pontibacter mangrovi]TPE46222.1 pyruvate dehydrogenase (acetyl-transferring) E1 component subunit alpha [Pontibacter mangrovi]